MNRHIAILALFAALLYGTAAYTRPHEPAGQYLHGTILPAVKEAMPECPRVPFSGLLKLDDYQPRSTGQPLEVVSPDAAGYSPEELSEIYPSH